MNRLQRWWRKRRLDAVNQQLAWLTPIVMSGERLAPEIYAARDQLGDEFVREFENNRRKDRARFQQLLDKKQELQRSNS